MPNVLFKRGLQNKLPQTGIEGTFYLTTDTNRLYTAQAGGKMVLLNQTIQIVASIDDPNDEKSLSKISKDWNEADGSALAHVNDVYYVSKDNILCIWTRKDNEYKWVQINPDHNDFVNNITQEVGVKNNTATVETTLAYNNGGRTITDSFGIQGDGITVTATGDTIKLKGKTYSIAKTSTAGEIKLSAGAGVDESSVKLVAGNNVQIANDSTGIKISATDTYVSGGTLALENDGSLELSLSKNSGGATIDIKSAPITFKVGADGAGQQTAKLGDDLSVYTKAQIDKKLNDLNGMTYIGTISNASGNGTFKIGTSANGFMPMSGSTVYSELKSGDMFLVSNDTTYASGKTAHQGDLLIATGTEGANGKLTAVTWEYIPSGNDVTQDTTYVFEADAATSTMKVTSEKVIGNGAEVGKLQFVGSGNETKDGGIKVSSTTSGGNGGNVADMNMVTTIEHKETTRNDPTANSVNLNTAATVKVITGVTTNKYGHVTGVQATTVTAPRYTEGDAEITVTNTGESYSTLLKQGIALGDANPVYNNGFKLNTSSLSITKTVEGAGTAAETPVLTVDMVWGTFGT